MQEPTGTNIRAGKYSLLPMARVIIRKKANPLKVLHKGDVVKIPPDTEHWHGAAPECGLTHIAISPNTDKGSVIWLQPVTDEEYNNIKVVGLYP